MIDMGYEANFEVVKGEKNLAKKFNVASAKGSFNNLFSQAPKKTRTPKTATEDNAISAVIPFKRKQA